MSCHDHCILFTQSFILAFETNRLVSHITSEIWWLCCSIWFVMIRYAHLTQASAQALAEMKEKIRILSNEVRPDDFKFCAPFINPGF